MDGREKGGAEQEGGEKAITNTPTKKEKMLFFQQVNSVAPLSPPVLVKLTSPHAVMKNSRTQPPWNHENCALLPPRDLLRP